MTVVAGVTAEYVPGVLAWRGHAIVTAGTSPHDL